MQAVNAGYAEANARMGPYQEVMFEGDKITLDIPKEGIELENGWTITPHTYPGVSLVTIVVISPFVIWKVEVKKLVDTRFVVWMYIVKVHYLINIYFQITKHQVDRFVPGRLVPSCQLYVKWTREKEQPVELLHRVQLLGAKEPFNFLIRPPSPLVAQSMIVFNTAVLCTLSNEVDIVWSIAVY